MQYLVQHIAAINSCNLECEFFQKAARSIYNTNFVYYLFAFLVSKDCDHSRSKVYFEVSIGNYTAYECNPCDSGEEAEAVSVCIMFVWKAIRVKHVV